jgi:hypothetical protein
MLDAQIDPAGDPSATLAKMMGDLATRDPQMAMLARLMQARASAPAAAVVEEETVDETVREIELLGARLTETQAQLSAVRAQGRKLFEAHREACDRLADLAAALGACGLCWGEDEHCPSCRGRGRPGMVRPDIELRTRLLGPPRRTVAPVAPA